MAGIDARNSLPTAPSAPTRPQAPERVQALREAQRAFFQAALSGEPSAVASNPPAPTVAKTTTTSPSAPGALLRPGSYVDIKV